MFHYLANAVKQRLILELQDSFSKHPEYNKIVPYIQNRFAFDERVNFGIVVKGSSGTKMQLQAENFLGTVVSHVFLGRVENYPGTTIDWVREDIKNISKSVTEDISAQFNGFNNDFTLSNIPIVDVREGEVSNNLLIIRVEVNGQRTLLKEFNGRLGKGRLNIVPSATDLVIAKYNYRILESPGIYYIDMVTKDSFMIDPLLIVEDEVLTVSLAPSQTTFNLDHFPILTGTLEIYRDGRILLVEGTHYSVNVNTGEITLLQLLPEGSMLTANYKYPQPSKGPFEIKQLQSNNQALKGVVLAFGRRNQKGDKQAIIISDKREQAARAYGGKWEMRFSLDVYAKDTIQMEEIVDFAVFELWAKKKDKLDAEGLVVYDVSYAGEGDEIYDETTGDNYYTGSFDVTLQTDWELHLPLPFKIKQVDFVKGGEDFSLSDDQAKLQEQSIQLLKIVPEDRVVFPNRSNSFERIV